MITILLEDAKKLLELYDHIIHADKIFRECQSQNFREHIRYVYKAENLKSAYAKLENKIDLEESKELSGKEK